MSFASVTFSSPRALYIKCTTCFSWYATRFCVICITLIRVLMSQPRVYGACRAIPACTGNIAVLHRRGIRTWSHPRVYREYAY